MIEHKLRVKEMEARAEHDQQMWALEMQIKLAQLALLKKQLGDGLKRLDHPAALLLHI